MDVNPYLNFKGDCEAAFKLYEQCLGAKPGGIFRYAASPMATDVPEDWQNKIMHASIEVNGRVVFGGDVPPDRYEQPKGFSLSVQLEDPAQAERIFDGLSKGGTVTVPLEKTFWAARFGMVVDRFGIPWMINCDEPAEALSA